MSDYSTQPWSDNPYAPRIPYSLYYTERTSFIGIFILAVLYGIILVLFFQCMGALFRPANRMRGGFKWGLVVHTVTIFLVVTMLTGPTLATLPITYIAYREFPGVRGGEFPGPWGYWANVLYFQPINAIPNTMFLLNNWLADGILLYRCWVIYANNYWIIAFPCLMYLVSIGTGAAFTYVQPDNNRPEIFVVVHDFGLSYFSISLSLNVILTFMIIARIYLHNRGIQKDTGGPFRTARIYNAVVAMLVESFALYAGSFVLFIATWGAGDAIQNVFYEILSATQVIAPFLIVLRVANRKALTSEKILSGTDGTLHFQTGRESTLDSSTLPDEYPIGSMGTNGEARVIGVKATIGENSPTVAYEVS